MKDSLKIIFFTEKECSKANLITMSFMGYLIMVKRKMENFTGRLKNVYIHMKGHLTKTNSSKDKVIEF